MRLALAALLLAAAACRRKAEAPPAPRVAVAGLELVRYSDPSGAFSLLAPADWRVREDDLLGPSVSFLGPGDERHPRSVSISAARYPTKTDAYSEPEEYYRATARLPGHERVSALRDDGGIKRYSYEKPFVPLHARETAWRVRVDVALAPVPGGFVKLEHAAPVPLADATSPAFEAAVRSFSAGPGTR